MNKIQPTHVSSKSHLEVHSFNYMEAKCKCVVILQLFDRSVEQVRHTFECYL